MRDMKDLESGGVGGSEIRARILEIYPKLSKGKKKIADWILRNLEEAAFSPAVMIGKAVGISESAVTRFALDAGFSGFRELQEAVQASLRDRLKIAERLKFSLESDRPDSDDLIRIFQRNIENIRESVKGCSQRDVERAADMIVGAEKIGVVGFRSAIAPGLVLYTFLNEILGNVRLITPALGDSFDFLRFWGPKDLVVGVSFLMSKNFTYDVVRFARERGCKIIGITDRIGSPLAEHADLTFLVQTQGEFISYSAAMALVDALLYRVTTCVKEQSLDSVAEVERILEHYFESRVDQWKK